MSADEQRFLDVVLADSTVRRVLERVPLLGLDDCGRTPCSPPLARSRRDPAGGRRRDADLFYFDADTSWEAEDAVIRAGAGLFADLPVPVEIRNEARVHLWYADRFGAAAPAPFRSAAEPIEGFAALCCYGLTVDRHGRPRVLAPHGYGDLFGLVVRPNPLSPAPRHVYEAKATRWKEQWPELTVLPWQQSPPH